MKNMNSRQKNRKKLPLIFVGTLASFFVGTLIFGGEVSEALRSPLTTTVDPENRIIEEKPFSITSSFSRTIAYLAESVYSLRYLGNLADPRVKYVRIQPGMRKEQIAAEFRDRLDWDTKEEAAFLATGYDEDGLSREGYFYPGVYIVPAYRGGEEVGEMLLNRFDQEIVARLASSTKKVLNVETIVKIASLVEREAAGKHDMSLISGIMWNRIWSGMTLDIDSSLQYAKGNEDNGWWPKVVPEDKYIESPYNTYQYEGLPPTAISSPSYAAIEAALKPKKTNCLFFIHDKYRRIHCSKTYEEHKRNIGRYL